MLLAMFLFLRQFAKLFKLDKLIREMTVTPKLGHKSICYNNQNLESFLQ